MSWKKLLLQKDSEVRKLVDEILPCIDDIPFDAVEDVTVFVKSRLEVYQRAVKPANGNGKLKTT